jgi:hypothetical protein
MRLSRLILLVAITVSIAGCEDDGLMGGPGSPSTLSGFWSGTLGDPTSTTALRITWTATQTGDAVTGPAIFVKPANNLPATGTLEGTLSGTALSLRFTALSGSVNGFPTCAISATGTATVTGTNAISGTMIAQFALCGGTGLESPESTLLTLTKQ